MISTDTPAQLWDTGGGIYLSFQCSSCKHTCFCTTINFCVSPDLFFNYAQPWRILFLRRPLEFPSLVRAGNITSSSCSVGSFCPKSGNGKAEESDVTANQEGGRLRKSHRTFTTLVFWDLVLEGGETHITWENL